MSDLERYARWNLEKERKYIERWQRMRERGFGRFMLVWGTVSALFMASLLVLSMAWSLDFSDPFVQRWARGTVLFGLGWGYVNALVWYGVMDWIMDRMIAKHLEIERADARSSSR